MPRVEFEPTIPTGERPQTYALDRAAAIQCVTVTKSAGTTYLCVPSQRVHCILAYTCVTLFLIHCMNSDKFVLVHIFLIQKTELLPVNLLFHFMLNELMLKSP